MAVFCLHNSSDLAVAAANFAFISFILSSTRSPTEESDKAAQQNNVDLNSIPDTSTAEGKKALDTATSDNDEEIAIEAPKSPFENFGNAILSKVDNSLFNQMSNIEKQTTILNLVGDDKVKYSESVDENGKKSISVSSDGENFESDAVGDANLVSKDGRVYLEIDDLNYSIDITDDLADGKEEVKVKDADNKERLEFQVRLIFF